MQWVLHIGIPKTGSKAIQHFLAGQANCIAGARLCFPAQGRVGVWHDPLFRSLWENDGRDLDAASPHPAFCQSPTTVPSLSEK